MPPANRIRSVEPRLWNGDASCEGGGIDVERTLFGAGAGEKQFTTVAHQWGMFLHRANWVRCGADGSHALTSGRQTQAESGAVLLRETCQTPARLEPQVLLCALAESIVVSAARCKLKWGRPPQYWSYWPTTEVRRRVNINPAVF